ncbi:DUF4333 domain-containing protein [Blastococcus mobilis]|uniref:DUF4333 domain-containing protein n=1 Tax=Blastococcus mobilis TaxID=1938746 RepID=A0A238WXA0_9ACTN|nr:DUF4333 domain-containing protein [Blastococcus mobilis]SNR51053.1 protein of unknown function [Blastococcus mobilis]
MTDPPQGRDQPADGRGDPYDPDRHPTRPVPSYERPPPAVGQRIHPGQVQQPYSRRPQPYPAQPYGQPYGPPAGPPQQYGVPPYGPGPYGQPAPQRRSRVGLIAGVTAGLLLLIAGAVVLALSLSSTVLDRTAVERDVAGQFEEREGVAIDLDCAEEMKVEAGATYECSGTTADGEDVTLRIAITDEDSAAYTWTEP